MLHELDNSNISRHLGQKSEYKAQYDKSLLVREPRQSNRTYLGIQDDAVPFVGQDTWNGYEISGLTDNGVPVVGVLKLAYPCNNKYIVESKSLKLYYNSFVMTKLGTTPQEVLQNIETISAKDLSELLETNVQVRVFSNDAVLDAGYRHINWHLGYETLENAVDVTKLDVSVYQETPELLQVVEQDAQSMVKYHSSLLRSLCRVTKQQDTGDIYIHIKSNKLPTKESLLKYIISYREECHFHEEICEAVYKRLQDALQPSELAVRCLYARRGSIDICPERASDANLLHTVLGNVNGVHVKTPKQ